MIKLNFFLFNGSFHRILIGILGDNETNGDVGGASGWRKVRELHGQRWFAEQTCDRNNVWGNTTRISTLVLQVGKQLISDH